MCYQTRLIKKIAEIMERFNAAIDELNDYQPVPFCSAFTYPKTPVITNSNPHKIELFNWGLIPEDAQDQSIRQYTLNARIETLDKKRSFKNNIQNRCLIPADGFYEWQWKTKSGSQKEKYLITLPHEELFAFAGIYSQWTDFNDQQFNSYTIVTTQANTLMATIHNTKQRMPVILKKEDESAWLQGEDYKQFGFPYSCDLTATSLNSLNDSQLELFG